MAVRSDIVIGADGRQSTVAALVNAETYLNGRSASGYVYGYYEDLERHGYHWHFGENVAAGVIPTNHGQQCVFVAVPGTAFPGHVSRKCRERLPPGPRGKLAASQRRCQSRSPGRPPAWLRRRPRASQAISRSRLGAGRRCRLLQGPADRPRHNRRTQGRGAAGPRDPRWKAGALEAYQHERDALSEPLFHVTEAITSFRWNLDEVKNLHASLSASMQAECEYMAGLPAPARREPQTRSGMSDRNAALASEAC